MKFQFKIFVVLILKHDEWTWSLRSYMHYHWNQQEYRYNSLLSDKNEIDVTRTAPAHFPLKHERIDFNLLDSKKHLPNCAQN
jgi:hypothetical protein